MYNWRPYAYVVADNVVLPTATPGQQIKLDGVFVPHEQRVLFKNIGNVYEYNMTTGTFGSPDALPVLNDAIFVMAGARKNTYWKFGNSGWETMTVILAVPPALYFTPPTLPPVGPPVPQIEHPPA